MSAQLPSHLLQFSIDKKPVVVWNVTRACNLKCVHCYAHATDRGVDGELKGNEALSLLKDLAACGVPVVLFSGGEPLMRPDLLELARCAVDYGMRAVISTNGTLITREKARDLKTVGLSYVGVSLDGIKQTHDTFRRMDGAFDKSMHGIRLCKQRGIKVLEGSSVPGEFIPRLARLFLDGRLPYDRLVSLYDFAHLPRALDDAAYGRVIKPVIRMPDWR